MLARWAVEEGAEIAAGQEIMDIETTKIANVFESPVAGVLRQKGGDGGRDGAGRRAARRRLGARRAGRGGGRIRRRIPGKLQAAGEGSRRRADAGDDRGGRAAHPASAAPGRTTGTPILLIHGFGADHDDMDVQPGGACGRPPGLCDRPARPWRLVEGASATARSTRSPTAVLAYMDAEGIVCGASRRPFARRRDRAEDRARSSRARRRR